jgi:hypothetical protein
MENNPKNKDAIKTSIGKKAFLIGNGINRSNDESTDRYKWENLLNDLNSDFANGEIKNISKKPFPMVYDEIVNYSLRQKTKKEGELKTFITKKINDLKHNSKYNSIRNIDGVEILTTNYDYLIENKLTDKWNRSPINKLEYFYSIYRFQESSKSRIWHIHGEQADSRSLLLGFRHYISYSAKVKSRAELFINGLRSQTNHENPSWVDLFFTHNIEIIGLGMLFTEYPIWWLLAYRNQKQISDSKIDINNTISLVYPSLAKEDYINTYIIDMLKAYSVKCREVPSKDYDDFYKKVLIDN